MKKMFNDEPSLEASVSTSYSTNAELQNIDVSLSAPLQHQSSDGQMDKTNNLQVHEVLKISCNICGKQLKNRITKRNHLKNVHGVNAKGKVVIRPVKNKVSCLYCEKQYSNAYNLQKHIDCVHLLDEQKTKMHSCSKCQYKTVYKQNLVKHIATHKNDTNVCPQGEPEATFKCLKCEAQFQSKKSLNMHKKKVHVTIKRNLSICRKCPLCSFTSSMYLKKEIHKHFEEVHNLNMKWEKHEFNSLDEFHHWKDVIEKTTVTSYVTVKTLLSDYLVYQCNRCGTYKPTSRGIRNTKLKGSCKINSFCPSEMKVNHKGEKIKVKYLAEHVGHKNQLEHTRFNAKDRKYISLLLINKVPIKEILRSANCVLDKQKLQSLQLVNTTDIDKIKTSCLSCFHESACSCIENSIKNNMCKNIHAVCRNIYPSDNAVKTCSSAQLDELNVSTILSETTHPESNEFEIRKSKVFGKFQGVLNALESKVNLTKHLDVMELKMKELESVLEVIASNRKPGIGGSFSI